MPISHLVPKKIIELQKYRDLFDIPAKIVLKVKLISRKQIDDSSISRIPKSDSENLDYSKYVSKIAKNPKKMRRFRRPYTYRQILEHVNWQTGQKYIDRFLELGGTKQEILGLPLKDKIGGPRKYYYPNYGWLNPTFIRYLAVKQEIKSLFNLEEISKIGEIGCGFGGQFLALANEKSLTAYYFYDLPPVQKIINSYISNYPFNQNVNFPDINEIEAQKFDLVISNYAFSELPKRIQIDYIEKLLLNSNRGYLIMNSGRSNHTSRNAGKLSLEELQGYMPMIKIMEENPLTGPDNYVIYWNRK